MIRIDGDEIPIRWDGRVCLQIADLDQGLYQSGEVLFHFLSSCIKITDTSDIGLSKTFTCLKIFDGKIESLTLEFIKILVRKGRESILPAIVDEALNLVRQQRNVRVAEVKTAAPMDDELRSRVSAALKNFHDGEVELKETVAPELLGGFQLLMDNRMIDASIKRELELLRRQITDHDYEPEF